ncbi:hypothetical protein BS50DRAFT_593970 [Corynespora cassiicola Philippines]|uniref:Uncharacterized protein n=1 Tax=Corynespora cassiicola Philippines TaxID=1448308 RepID=A0A2T2N4M4_CORCC|nr:hypothetical protein BS50DRAFT_593970 [Corynespora cassiicola Philippines]
MYLHISEKTKSVLPFAESPWKTPVREKQQASRKVCFTEVTLLALSFVIALFQLYTLYPFDEEIPYEARSMLDTIALGLSTSTSATFPTAAITGLAAPYIARKDRVAVARYTILLCFLVGSTVGAVVFGRQLEMQRARLA